MQYTIPLSIEHPYFKNTKLYKNTISYRSVLRRNLSKELSTVVLAMCVFSRKSEDFSGGYPTRFQVIFILAERCFLQ